MDKADGMLAGAGGCAAAAGGDGGSGGDSHPGSVDVGGGGGGGGGGYPAAGWMSRQGSLQSQHSSLALLLPGMQQQGQLPPLAEEGSIMLAALSLAEAVGGNGGGSGGRSSASGTVAGPALQRSTSRNLAGHTSDRAGAGQSFTRRGSSSRPPQAEAAPRSPTRCVRCTPSPMMPNKCWSRCRCLWACPPHLHLPSTGTIAHSLLGFAG